MKSYNGKEVSIDYKVALKFATHLLSCDADEETGQNVSRNPIIIVESLHLINKDGRIFPLCADKCALFAAHLVSV